MAILEAQLDTWSKQGSVTQSKNTCATVKNALEASGAGYVGKSCESFLQGSYGNDTNVYADSDVDVIMKLNSAFFRDLTRLSPSDLAAYNAEFGGNVEYGFRDFKRDVEASLRKQFGNDVQPEIKPSGSSRTAAGATRTLWWRFSSAGTTSSRARATSVTMKVSAFCCRTAI